MSNLEKAAKLSLEEWSEQIDQELKEAEARGELPNKTPEQLRAEAKAVWQKAHTKNVKRAG